MPYRRLILVLVLASVLVLPGLQQAGAAVAAAQPFADPVIGPHVLDELRHQHDRLPFAPMGAAIIPRAAQPATPAGPVGPSTASDGNGTLLKDVFGFAPYWNLQTIAGWPASNYNLISTVAYFGLGIRSDGTLNTSTDDAGWQHWANDGNLPTIITGAHAAGDAVVLVIKPWNAPGVSTAATLNAIVTSQTATQGAISAAISAAESKSLDGINVDFEGSSVGYPNVQAGFTNFMKQLTSQVHSTHPQWSVTVDTYSGSASWDGGIFNIGDLAPNVDAFFDMAYDMGFGDIPGHAAPNAPLTPGSMNWPYNDTTSVNQYLGKAPASKIILGVPYYGYKYCTVDANPYSALSGSNGKCPDPDQPDPLLKTNNPDAVTYSGIYDDLACAQQLTKKWDSDAQEPWATWYSPATNDPCGGNHDSIREMYYDDANSIAYKDDLVIQSGIRGTGMWALGNDGSYPELWTVIKNKFATLYGAWLGASDGGVFSLGTTPFYGSMGGRRLNAPIVGMARTPTKAGYWLVASDGGIFTFGDATFSGSTGGMHLTKPIVGMAATPDGKGYWLVAADGGIFTFGNAGFFGSEGGKPLNRPIVGMAATLDAKGYWLVASDGGIFTFGDAGFFGSEGGRALNKPIVGMAATLDGKGYWLVASDGGIFTHGDAGFFGSEGGRVLNQPIVGMAATSDGLGYWLVASDGGIFTHGDAVFFGSLARLRLNAPIVGIATVS